MQEIKNLLAHGVPITFVTSFARSGNTWMRYLLSDVFLQSQGIDTATKLVIHPDEIIPDFYRSLVAVRDQTVGTNALLLKIHDPFKELRERFWGDSYRTESSFQRCRHLYLFRSPEDALVSLYHYHLRHDLVVEKSTKWIGPSKIDAFCREALPGWMEHVSGYLEAAESGVPIYFASYEQLSADSKKVLGEILQWLGVPHTAVMLERATWNMQFQKLKATDARDMGHHGRSGAGSNQLEPSTVELIRAETAHIIERANRRARVSALSALAPVPDAFSHEEQLRDGRSNMQMINSTPRVV
ncbi:MAG TPA: sulfotransferase domain-containing protein [Verrucomicrobiae bacterium]|nr:sulfotransferase domain-containing protein [Verrucomicrobiae bacterium]